MDPNSNRFHPLREATPEERTMADLLREDAAGLVAPSDAPMLVTADEHPPRLIGPDWPVFTIGQEIPLNGYRFRVAATRGDALLLKAIGPTKAAAKRATRR